ncbi:Transcriptional regulator [Burkholderiales bacterium]|jgi:DNA-binding MarR family transcriptional regulator|nr:Transcriptional regulator [Burkholderiales bacterium]
MSKPGPDALGLAARIRRAVAPLSRKLRPSLQRDGISTAKLSLIGHLNRHGPVTPTELAAREGVKLQSLTRMLADLEADGWVVRAPHPSDGRQSLLTLTRVGAKSLANAAQSCDAVLAQIIATRCSASDRAVLRRACTLLDDLCDGMSGTIDAAQQPAVEMSAARRRRS